MGFIKTGFAGNDLMIIIGVDYDAAKRAVGGLDYPPCWGKECEKVS